MDGEFIYGTGSGTDDWNNLQNRRTWSGGRLTRETEARERWN